MFPMSLPLSTGRSDSIFVIDTRYYVFFDGR
jgi:hypothetical protein